MRYAVLIALCGLSLTACDGGDDGDKEVWAINTFHIQPFIGALVVAIAVLGVVAGVARVRARG
jgi:hypothetical protein